MPAGGAVITALPLAAFGAHFGWGYPIAPGAGWPSYLLQAVFGAGLLGGFGAVLGAVIGFLAALPSYGILWGRSRFSDNGHVAA